MNKIRITRYASCLLAICGIGIAAEAQYYYKDIVVTAQINANYRALRNNKVNIVTITPSAQDPADNSVTLQQTHYSLQKLLVTYTKTPAAGESWLKSYYNEGGLLIKTTDSSSDVVTTSLFEYDSAGRLAEIGSNSIPVNSPAETEVHKWNYNSSGRPLQMIKIKNNADTTLVLFTADEAGNVGEEKAKRKKENLSAYYYYYDAERRLTDVARYNEKANRILPDYMFEYNEATRLSQMIIVPEGSSEYLTWKYFYNQQGLKEKEVCYNRQKQLIGRVEYAYTFGK